MSAPALVVVVKGSRDPRVAQVAHALREQLSTRRAEIDTHVAFLTSCPPSGMQVVSQFAALPGREIVYVPLDLARAVDPDESVAALLRRSRATHPDLRFALSRPVGPEPALLTVLDARLRAALAHARCLELDGLVLSSEQGGDVRGSALLARRARQWAAHHKLPCVVAVSDDGGPGVGQAIMSLRSQGRRHIAVGSFFLAADEAYQAQSDQAYRYGAISVSEPLGAAREIIDVILSRYAFAAMELLEFADEYGDEPAREERQLHLVGA